MPMQPQMPMQPMQPQMPPHMHPQQPMQPQMPPHMHPQMPMQPQVPVAQPAFPSVPQVPVAQPAYPSMPQAMQVPMPPPRPRFERRPRMAPQGQVWVAGHWTWNNNQWAWNAGHFEAPPRPRARWVAPQVVRRGRTWQVMPGRWR